MSGARAPGPLLLLGCGLCMVAFSVSQPIVMAAVLLGAVALQLASDTPGRLVFAGAAVIGLGVTVLNPFVQASGELILFTLPDVPIFDMQVTLEELVAGVTLGARAAAVTIVAMAVLALADADRLQELAGRLMPRSALAASIAGRLLPTLRRDAQALVETAQLRGGSPLSGPWRRRASAAGSLALPLVGSALDRSLDVAEAMTARGYGSGPRTRRPPMRHGAADRVVLACALALCALGTVGIATTLGDYRFFPTLAPITLGAIVAATAVLTASAFAAKAARR